MKKYEKLRGEIHNQETAQEILQLTRRASTEERSVQRYMSTAGCEQQHSQMENPQAENPVTIARRSHLFPSRTQKLSSLAPMILGGKLPGKVGRCRFFIALMKDSLLTVFFLFCRNPAASLLSESMVSFDPLCGIAARKETMKLAGLRLRVIWTLPVFYYLDLRMIEIKN